LADDATIRIQPLGGLWETLGIDRLRGIVPEDIQASCNSWGPDTLNFVLKSEAGARRPDVLPFTPVDLELGGMLCWSGFVWQRPSDVNGYSVGCRGWQYHLDDDLLDRVYVHTRLGDYRDQRTFLGANLSAGNFIVSGVVSIDDGVVVIGWPNGAVLGGGGANVGVTLDLGPDSTGKRVVMTWESVNNAAAGTATVRGTDGESYGSAGESIISFAMNTGASGTSAATFTTARRYIHIALATSGTLAIDAHLRITGMKVFRATAYESGNASILKADTVLKDVLALAPLLNQSTSAIAAGTFSIPEWLTGGYLTPRQIAEAVNAYENYRLKIGGADLRTLVYDAKPSAPILEVGEWSGAEFSDATVSGEPIYDTAVVDATGPDGGRLVSKRTQIGTLVDRRSFHRSRTLPISTAVTSAVADRFGDLWLTEHRTAPFAGRLVLTGASARRVTGGGSVPAYELLLYAGEKIRLSNRLDPDTGGWGRDGRIAGVTYHYDARQADVAIDDQRDRFESVLARYGVLVDQFS
jgi:hypothetical protein